MVSSNPQRRESGYAWVIMVMAMLFMMINFGDKVVIGLAAGPIMKDLNLTHEEFGAVGSAFFLLFSISAVVVGIAVNRVRTKTALAVMAFIWAVTQMPMIGVVTLPVLIASRVVLGAGEGPAFPVALHAIYKWFPTERRALPTSLASIGAPIGIAVLSPLLGWIIVTYSWHAAFGFLGVIGFAWLAVWMVVGREGPLDASQPEAGGAGLEHVSYWQLLTSRTFIGVTLCGFAAYWAVALAIVWLPSFLVDVAGYSQASVGWLATLPPMLQIVLSPAMGLLSQKLRARGVSSRVSQGVLACGAVLVCGLSVIIMSQMSGKLAVLPAIVAFAICGTAFAIGPTLVGEISPVRQRGAALGICNGVFTTAGLIAPWLMGHIVDVGANPVLGFRHGFLDGGILIVIAALLAMWLIHPEKNLARFRQGGAALNAGEASARS